MTAKTTNQNLINVIKLLKMEANEADIWDTLAKKLSKSRRNRISVNISKINRYATSDEIVVVPGKVLGSGVLNHRIHVAALDFSRKAKTKIKGAGGTCLTIPSLLHKNPKGSRIKIIG